MEPLGTTRIAPNSLHIEGVPDAVKLIKVDGPKARRLGDLALHRSDLNFTLECLEVMEHLPEDQALIRDALWRSAVIHYLKCFGDSQKRFQLDPTQVHKGCPPETHQAFEWFKSLRNKHIAHDENAYKQSAVGAAINAGNKSFKVEKIVSVALTFRVDSPANLRNLRLLTQRAVDWVVGQYDECAKGISDELEGVPYDDLAARPALQTHGPTVDDMHAARP